MRKISQLILIATFCGMITPALAQSNCDPWIVSIYKQLYNRQPSADECNIRNYNNGSWSSYQQLTGFIKGYQSSRSGGSSSALSPSMVTGDPWIMEIYQKTYGRRPNSWELNIRNYNNGSWSSYDELAGYIRQFQKSLSDNGLVIETALLNDRYNLVAIKKGNEYLSANILENKGGNVVAAGGANVISAGGANVVSAGGANVVSAGGANVVAAGGGNVISAGGANLRYSVASTGAPRISVSPGLLGAGFGSGYSIQSGAKLQVKTSGNGSIVFK
ncbi:MAG TPA: hypothetical protein VGD22_07290 [Sphingobacteriaceae bacterium]